jgi:hypothetical protein
VNFQKTVFTDTAIQLFYKIFAQKMINCQFLSYDIENA